jgi:hypothetical protein
LFDDHHQFVEIIHTNELREKRVRNKNRSISYVVLRVNRVQNSMSDFIKHDVHNRQNIEIDDYVDFVFVIFVINVQMMFFVVVVISFAFVVSIVFFFRRIDRDRV